MQRFTKETERQWQKKTKVIPVLIGGHSALPKDLEEHLNNSMYVI